MRVSQLACVLALVLGLVSVRPAQAKCKIVECLVDPCTTTTCKPPNPDWKCVANYCGGCKTDWLNTKTGLKISTCPPSICPRIYAPVCGTNGVTYPNACIALRNGAKVKYTGKCKCPKTKAPVCGADGITYRNRCAALNNGTTVAYAGTCLFPTKCAKDNLNYNPVCDTDTRLTWTNACVAKLNKLNNTTDGACIGFRCASCVINGGCGQPHRCKDNPKYTCTYSACESNQILDNGTRVTFGLCSAIYKNKSNGYPAAACYDPK